jgi:hypothetical protein
MTKVFIGGPRTLESLHPGVKQRLDTYMDKGRQVLIGDADGADKAVQAYLKVKRHRDVQVYFVGNEPRNNLGKWVVRQVDPDGAKRGLERDAARDRVMAHEAEAGFMVWDGKDVDTIMNVWRLVVLRKTTVIFDSRTQSLFNVRTAKDWRQMTRGIGITRTQRLQRFLEIESAYGDRVWQGMRSEGRKVVLN